MKFYRGGDKPKKIRKRFTQNRSWLRTFKWTCYHAHPLNIVGHPFKGANILSIGYLNHPDMKRFMINDATLFAPIRPDAAPGAATAGSSVPSFADFFGTYFHGRSFTVTNAKCSSMLESMKRCWENNAAGSPAEQCSYYINGFERLACASK